VTGSATISAAASDTSGIARVEFYVDWILERTVKTAPYDYDWSTGSAGSHTITAMAYSEAGVRACYALTLSR
jgi:hypothetical protein